jgi:DNA-binding XRE family transcriptional regulator
MNKKEVSWEKGEKRIFINPDIARECEKLEPEFQALRQLILLRKKHKITQQRLAEKISMRQSHVARLETGEITPTLKVLKRYANGLNQVLTFNIVSREEYYRVNQEGFLHNKTGAPSGI